MRGWWACCMAPFFVQLLILTVLLHRFGSLRCRGDEPDGGLDRRPVPRHHRRGGRASASWFGGQIGAAKAFTAISPSRSSGSPSLLLEDSLLPQLNDIQTTRQAMESHSLPPCGLPTLIVSSNLILPPLKSARKAYPDIRPMELERSVTETFDIVHEAVSVLVGPSCRASRPTKINPGRIEATNDDDHGLHRRCADPRHRRRCPRLHRCPSRRYGKHDLGANAGNIREPFVEAESLRWRRARRPARAG